MIHGAVNPSRRRPAMKVCVPRRTKGAFAFSRCPRGARPRRRVIRVVTEVSSRNTSRSSRWHSKGISQRNQRRRRLATSARSISCAARAFFICPARPPEQTRQRARVGSDAVNVLQSARQVGQDDVGLCLHPADQHRPERPELAAPWRSATAARFGRAGRVHPRQELDRAAWADTKPLRRCTPR
jgi:hypothetical protein